MQDENLNIDYLRAKDMQDENLNIDFLGKQN